MASLQAEHASIVAQLDGFLRSSDLPAAIACITSRELRAKLEEIDDKWEGLRERGAVTLECLKAVVHTVREGMFCGEGHILYVQVRNMQREGVGEYLYPVDNRGSTFEYVVPDGAVYRLELTLRSAEDKTVLSLRFELAGVDRKGGVDFMLNALLQTCL
jgi:hypothetical protein